MVGSNINIHAKSTRLPQTPNLLCLNGYVNQKKKLFLMAISNRECNFSSSVECCMQDLQVILNFLWKLPCEDNHKRRIIWKGEHSLGVRMKLRCMFSRITTWYLLCMSFANTNVLILTCNGFKIICDTYIREYKTKGQNYLNYALESVHFKTATRIQIHCFYEVRNVTLVTRFSDCVLQNSCCSVPE